MLSFTRSFAPVWVRGFGDATDQVGPAHLAVDRAGNVVLAGALQGTIDAGGGQLTSLGASDVLVVKLDPAGNHLWSLRLGDAEPQQANAIALVGATGAAIVGSLSGAPTFGATKLTSAGGADAFAALLATP